MSIWHTGECKKCGKAVLAPIGQAVPDSHRVCIDIERMQRERDQEIESERSGASAAKELGVL